MRKPKLLPKPSVPNIYIRCGAYEVYLTIPSLRPGRSYIGRRSTLDEAIALRDSMLDELARKGIPCGSRREYSSGSTPEEILKRLGG